MKGSKQIAAIIVTSVLGLGMICTMFFGYRAIGSDLLSALKQMDRYSGIAKIDVFLDSLEKGWNDGSAIRPAAIDFYGYLQRLMGKKIIYDADPGKTVMKGSDGKLYYLRNATGSEEDASENENIKRLSQTQNFCDSRNVDFLCVITPHKYYSKQVTLPMEAEDHTASVQRFKSSLEKNGVNCLNLMDKWIQDSEAFSDGFFITDHHWNIQTAFWAFQSIADRLNEISNSPIDEFLLDDKSYTTEIVQNCFLGSMGQRTGRYYAGMDDIAVIKPVYKTDFTVEFTTKTLGTQIVRTGPFSESILDAEIGYNMYITSDNALIHVDNTLNNNGRKVLLVKDSFGVPVAAWLACIADELWVVDLRYAQEESMYDMIEHKEIDTVVTLYNPEVIGAEWPFAFDVVSSGR